MPTFRERLESIIESRARTATVIDSLSLILSNVSTMEAAGEVPKAPGKCSSTGV
jgi:hypothetical protein